MNYVLLMIRKYDIISFLVKRNQENDSNIQFIYHGFNVLNDVQDWMIFDFVFC